jgi:hypothetical protein
MVVNDKNVSNIRHMSHLRPSLEFSKMWSLTKNNVIQFRWSSLRILFWWLLKAICHCLLWIPLGWSEQCFFFVVKSNVLVNLFMNTFLLCYRKPHKFMCLLPLVNCNYDINVWFMDVNVKLWHFRFDHQFHYPKLGSLSHNYWTI